MRELFDRLRMGGEAAFEALRDQRIEEDLQLEIKGKASAERPGLSGDDKSRVGEALSGFSNSAGGLLVLGVDCREGADGVDCVQGLEPFIGPNKIASDIRGMLGSLLQPSNDGIEIAHVDSVARPGYGYVIILIPRSDRRPHQSRASGQFKYYKRMGRSFHPMEHYDVEDAFSRGAAPTLTIRISALGSLPISPTDFVYNYQVELINTSDNIAKLPFIMFSNMHGCGLNQRYYTPPYKLVPAARGGSLVGGQNDIIHPGMQDIAGQISVLFQRTIHPDTHQPSIWRLMNERSLNDGPSFDYIFGCEGMRGEAGHWSMTRDQFGPAL